MKRFALVSTAAAAILCSNVSFAQPAAQGFAVNHFEPATTGSEWFVMDTLDLRGHLRPAFGIVGEWAYRPLVLETIGTDDVRKSIVRDQAFLHLGGSLVLWDRLRVGASVPVMVYADGHSFSTSTTTYAAPAHEAALGDIRLDADLRLVGKYQDPATLAIGATVSLPTGNRDSYAGDGNTTVTPHLLLAGDVSYFTYAARLGAEIKTLSESYAGGQVGTALVFGAAAGVRVASTKLVVGPEVFGRSTLINDGFFKIRSTPVEGLLGAHYTISDFRAGAGVSTGFSEGFGTPVFRGILSLEWVPQPASAPPPAAPPPAPVVETDRDHDGIPDAVDACIDVPGVKTDDPATNGCPPVLDRDHDGIPDAADACIDVPGIKTDDPKTNGCPPDPDRDHDGIKNDDDACPDEAGKADPDPKKNGCPKAFVRDGQIQILEQVKFATASAVITKGPDSESVLQAVADVLTGHPEITKIRVEGHTDNRGNAASNKKLSAARAASVVKWLTAHGIDGSRLTSEGHGQEVPIADNKTEEGRRQNRRVEFHIAGAPTNKDTTIER